MITMQLSYTSLKHRGITIYRERWTVLGLFMKFFGEWKKRSFSLFLFNQHTNESTTSRTFKGAQCIGRGSNEFAHLIVICFCFLFLLPILDSTLFHS